MLRILGPGHSVSTVTELIFVRAQCLSSLFSRKVQNAFTAKWLSTELSQQDYTRIQTKHATRAIVQWFTQNMVLKDEMKPLWKSTSLW
jgi:hypothetical protein